MGTVSDYFCKRCANVFNACCGGGFFFVELRCEACDATQTIDREKWPVDYHSMFKDENPKLAAKYPTWAPGAFAEAKSKFRCPKCAAQMHDELKPMCPKCRSRDIVEGSPNVFFD